MSAYDSSSHADYMGAQYLGLITLSNPFEK